VILFVTEQYAGAEYLLPLLKHWREVAPTAWSLVATGASVALWRKHGFAPLEPEGDALSWLRKQWKSLDPNAVLASASAASKLERAAVLLARENGKPSAQFLDMWTNYKMRFEVDTDAASFPDFILAIDKRCIEEACSDGLTKANYYLIGQPYFEELIERRPPLGRHVLLAGQPIAKYCGRAFGYDETDFWRVAGNCFEGVSAVMATRHPEEATGGHHAMAMVPGRGCTDVAESHTVLGMYSTQMIIGYLWGRKVASLQPGLRGADPCPLSRWGVIPRLESELEVVDFLAQPGDPNLGDDLRCTVKGSLKRLEAFCLMVG
jgi:hypothetical protein